MNLVWVRDLVVTGNAKAFFWLVWCGGCGMGTRHFHVGCCAGIMVSHPGRKNKDAPRVGHPEFLGVGVVWRFWYPTLNA